MPSQGHTTSKWWSEDSNPRTLAPEPTFWTTKQWRLPTSTCCTILETDQEFSVHMRKHVIGSLLPRLFYKHNLIRILGQLNVVEKASIKYYYCHFVDEKIKNREVTHHWPNISVLVNAISPNPSTILLPLYLCSLWKLKWNLENVAINYFALI